MTLLGDCGGSPVGRDRRWLTVTSNALDSIPIESGSVRPTECLECVFKSRVQILEL